MRRRLRRIIRKEFLQTVREPRMRLMLFLPPILQLIIFGYAVNLDVDNSRLAWMDLDHTPESRELLADFEGSGRFTVVRYPETGDELQHALDAGAVDTAVRILPGFARDLKHGRTTAVEVLVDGTNSNTGSIVSGYAASIVSSFAAKQNRDRSQQMLVGRTTVPVYAPVPRLDMQERVWFNPDLRSRNYFVPGVVVNIMMLITLMLTAMAIVREKEIGTMEQLMVTPIRPLELMLGKTLPFAIVGLVDMCLVVAVALTLFRVPFRGNMFTLLLASLLFLMTTLGSGLFMSTISRTQQQAMLTTFLFFMPAFLLSGFAFPIRNMPLPAQYLTYVNPVRYFMTIVRGVFLKGAGVSVLWPEMLALAIFGVLILSLSAFRFRKTLD
ncbi:MAG TPA: ABC transporter permease [Bryobacteraceae bacterium]|nr:ABC transporter permease [Bryobacteraceae bacterium]